MDVEPLLDAIYSSSLSDERREDGNDQDMTTIFDSTFPSASYTGLTASPYYAFCLTPQTSRCPDPDMGERMSAELQDQQNSIIYDDFWGSRVDDTGPAQTTIWYHGTASVKEAKGLQIHSSVLEEPDIAGDAMLAEFTNLSDYIEEVPSATPGAPVEDGAMARYPSQLEREAITTDLPCIIGSSDRWSSAHDVSLEAEVAPSHLAHVDAPDTTATDPPFGSVTIANGDPGHSMPELQPQSIKKRRIRKRPPLLGPITRNRLIIALQQDYNFGEPVKTNGKWQCRVPDCGKVSEVPSHLRKHEDTHLGKECPGCEQIISCGEPSHTLSGRSCQVAQRKMWRCENSLCQTRFTQKLEMQEHQKLRGHGGIRQMIQGEDPRIVKQRARREAKKRLKQVTERALP